MTKQSTLGQYYTPSDIAAQIVDKSLQIMGTSPLLAVELAAGEGHLLAALEAKAPNCKMYAIDIDALNCTSLSNKHPTYLTFNADATRPLEFLTSLKFDFALANPPFLNNVVVNEFVHNLLHDVLDLFIPLGRTIRAEYVFICQYLSVLAKGGTLAIILPDTLVSGVKSRDFRQSLLKNIKILEIVELTGRPFLKTEAKTHVFFIKKTPPDDSQIKLSTFDSTKETIEVHPDSLLDRMDYSYHIDLVRRRFGKRLSDHASINRGKMTHNQLKLSSESYMHSTTFNNDFKLNHVQVSTSGTYVKKGDVIMCRVGTRVAGKVREYNGSPVIYSDCIFNIQFSDDQIKKEFLDFANSPDGKDAIVSLLRGVCSKYITKNDLAALLF